MSKEIQVVDYEIAWNPQQAKGVVSLKFSNGATAKYTVTSLAEIAGWVALLDKRSVFASSDGWLYAAGTHGSDDRP